MVITAALIWYDERPEDLAICVRGVAEIADRLVAVDGAYRRYPDANVASPSEQADAIRTTAAELGVDCEVHVPERLWAGQVEKRTFALTRAALGADWIVIVDADWRIHADREAARAELASYGPDVDVVSVTLYTPPSRQPFATNWHRKVAGQRSAIPHFFRPLPGLRVETLHWWYSAMKNGRRVWMWHGPEGHQPVLPQHPLGAYYEIEHRCLLRDEKHILAGRAFCNDRVMVLERTGQEDDVPGLPEPLFDYETVPY